MPIYVYWGEDDFAIASAILRLRDRFVDPQWLSFNYTALVATQPEAIVVGLDQALTPPFGAGSRLVWIETNLTQQCSADLLAQLQRTLAVIPDTSILVISSRQKPDKRLKSTQLLQKHAEFQEFLLIPPWDTEQIAKKVQQVAQELGLKLASPSIQLLAESVGNNTRQLYNELEKLRTFAGNDPIDAATVASLVSNTTQSSLQLAAAIKAGNSVKALELVTQLLSHNEPALRIVATLIGQFRTWLWVKLMSETNNNITAIAQAAEVANPNRVYILQKEVRSVSVQQLMATLPLLLQLEVSLKQGAEETSILHTKIIELCQVLRVGL